MNPGDPRWVPSYEQNGSVYTDPALTKVNRRLNSGMQFSPSQDLLRVAAALARGLRLPFAAFIGLAASTSRPEHDSDQHSCRLSSKSLKNQQEATEIENTYLSRHFGSGAK